MRYASGEEVRVGDRVRVGPQEGTVVFSIDTDEYTPEFPRDDWAYLKEGVMVEMDNGALVVLHQSDSSMMFPCD